MLLFCVGEDEGEDEGGGVLVESVLGLALG